MCEVLVRVLLHHSVSTLCTLACEHQEMCFEIGSVLNVDGAYYTGSIVTMGCVCRMLLQVTLVQLCLFEQIKC